jgi:hypothetical protein
MVFVPFPTRFDYSIDWKSSPPKQNHVFSSLTQDPTNNPFVYLPREEEWGHAIINGQSYDFLDPKIVDRVWLTHLENVKEVCVAANGQGAYLQENTMNCNISFEHLIDIKMIAPIFGPVASLINNPLRVSGTKGDILQNYENFQQMALKLMAWIEEAKSRSQSPSYKNSWNWPKDPKPPLPYVLRPYWELNKQERPLTWTLENMWGIHKPTSTQPLGMFRYR